MLSKVPLKPGTSYSVQVEWTSKYGTKATGTASVTAAETSISLPIYHVTLRLLTPRGAPIVGVPVKVANVDVGATDVTGGVLVPQIPPGSYSVAASWLETALSLPSLVVSAPGAVTLTPTNLHVLTVRVIDSQGQALEGATVKLRKGTVGLTKLTDEDGRTEIELPDASYIIDVSYGQFSKTDSVSLTADTLKTVTLDLSTEVLEEEGHVSIFANNNDYYINYSCCSNTAFDGQKEEKVIIVATFILIWCKRILLLRINMREGCCINALDQ
ncbi:MAG: carboxypeptidase-like regulatory domain-containing protein [Candidatus Jordarchaeales archaeon]